MSRVPFAVLAIVRRHLLANTATTHFDLPSSARREECVHRLTAGKSVDDRNRILGTAVLTFQFSPRLLAIIRHGSFISRSVWDPVNLVDVQHSEGKPAGLKFFPCMVHHFTVAHSAFCTQPSHVPVTCCHFHSPLGIFQSTLSVIFKSQSPKLHILRLIP